MKTLPEPCRHCGDPYWNHSNMMKYNYHFFGVCMETWGCYHSDGTIRSTLEYLPMGHGKKPMLRVVSASLIEDSH